jgi:hypothetical protein
MIWYNIKTFSASELNQMTRQNLLDLPWSSALQHKIHVQQGCSQNSGTDFINISCKPYRDNKLKKLLSAVSNYTSRDMLRVSHGSVSLSGVVLYTLTPLLSLSSESWMRLWNRKALAMNRMVMCKWGHSWEILINSKCHLTHSHHFLVLNHKWCVTQELVSAYCSKVSSLDN